MTNHETIKRTFYLSREEFLYVILIAMTGVNMYWTAILLDPIQKLNELQLDEQQYNTKQAKVAIQQNQKIIDNQNNNTDRLIDLTNRQNTLLENQILVVNEIRNGTQQLAVYGLSITDSVETVIQQGDEVARMIGYFRNLLDDEYVNATIVARNQTREILNNVTENNEKLNQLLENISNSSR